MVTALNKMMSRLEVLVAQKSTPPEGSHSEDNLEDTAALPATTPRLWMTMLSAFINACWTLGSSQIQTSVMMRISHCSQENNRVSKEVRSERQPTE